MLGRVAFVFVALWVIAAFSYSAAPDRVGNPDWGIARDNDKRETCVTVDLNRKKHKVVLDHAWDAIKDGAPRRMHIDRKGADENRDESTGKVELWSRLPLSKRRKYNPNTGEFDARRRYKYAAEPHDRDEYPVAMSEEGGEDATIRYVRADENRDAGREMGLQLRGYKDGQCFQYEKRSR
jgi:hypothetical protein